MPRGGRQRRTTRLRRLIGPQTPPADLPLEPPQDRVLARKLQRLWATESPCRANRVLGEPPCETNAGLVLRGGRAGMSAIRRKSHDQRFRTTTAAGHGDNINLLHEIREGRSSA